MFNRFANQEFCHYVAALFCLGGFILISSLYLVIQLDETVPKLIGVFWGCVFVVDFILATFLSSYGIKIRTLSKACCTANKARRELSKIEIKFWSSAWPINIDVGNVFKMETKLLIPAYYSAVFQCLVTLLLGVNIKEA